jgi:hypothetical protein
MIGTLLVMVGALAAAVIGAVMVDCWAAPESLADNGGPFESD